MFQKDSSHLRVACCVLRSVRVACARPSHPRTKTSDLAQLHKTLPPLCPLSGGRWLLTYLPPPLLLLATPPLLLMSWAAAARSCLRVAPFKPMHLVPIMILHTSSPAVYPSSLLLYLIHSYSHNTYKAYVSGIKLKTQADYGLSDHTAVLHEDNMYIYGGVSVDNNLLPTIQVFNFGIATPTLSFYSHFSHSVQLHVLFLPSLQPVHLSHGISTQQWWVVGRWLCLEEVLRVCSWMIWWFSRLVCSHSPTHTYHT